MGTVNGLPAHVLLVHAIVVLLPLAALLLVLTAVWPAARSRLAGPNAILSAREQEVICENLGFDATLLGLNPRVED